MKGQSCNMECSFDAVRFGNYFLIKLSPCIFQYKLLDNEEFSHDKCLSLKRQQDLSAD
jgi:hypothetical protein